MITHFFVHPSQLKDKKGSCLAPFVDIIKNLGFGLEFKWNRIKVNKQSEFLKILKLIKNLFVLLN